GDAMSMPRATPRTAGLGRGARRALGEDAARFTPDASGAISNGAADPYPAGRFGRIARPGPSAGNPGGAGDDAAAGAVPRRAARSAGPGGSTRIGPGIHRSPEHRACDWVRARPARSGAPPMALKGCRSAARVSRWALWGSTR